MVEEFCGTWRAPEDRPRAGRTSLRSPDRGCRFLVRSKTDWPRGPRRSRPDNRTVPTSRRSANYGQPGTSFVVRRSVIDVTADGGVGVVEIGDGGRPVLRSHSGNHSKNPLNDFGHQQRWFCPTRTASHLLASTSAIIEPSSDGLFVRCQGHRALAGAHTLCRQSYLH